jgi:hypothetical protein
MHVLLFVVSCERKISRGGQDVCSALLPLRISVEEESHNEHAIVAIVIIILVIVIITRAINGPPERSHCYSIAHRNHRQEPIDRPAFTTNHHRTALVTSAPPHQRSITSAAAE